MASRLLDRGDVYLRCTNVEVAMATAREKQMLLTADDLLRLYSEGVRGELIQGVLHETMASGEEHGEIVTNMVLILGGFVKPRRLGRLVASDVGVRLERDPDTVREPDLAFVSAEKRPLDVRNAGYLEVVPDLVVEIVSPGDRPADVVEKARMWLSFDAGLVWVVYPETRTVGVHRPDASEVMLGENDTLDGGAALPGFSCTVRDIFEL